MVCIALMVDKTLFVLNCAQLSGSCTFDLFRFTVTIYKDGFCIVFSAATTQFVKLGINLFIYQSMVS